jgi:hypothetical protein
MCLQELMVRPFATAGASLQLGWFQRPTLDFTRLVAKLDLGLPGAQQASHREFWNETLSLLWFQRLKKCCVAILESDLCVSAWRNG